MNTNLLTGRVSRADRNRFTVRYDGQEYFCQLRGSFFTDDAERPVVGDFVTFSPGYANEGMIETILPRKSVLARPDQSGHAAGYVKTMQSQVMTANFDYVFIITSLNEDYSVSRVARYVSLVLEGGGIPAVILTKADLCPDYTTQLAEIYALSDKVRVHAVSVKLGKGLTELTPYLIPGTTIALVGSSGVGKSTLANYIAGHEIMKTNAIREKDGKGRHTTTARQLFELESGVTLIDTPGMREIGLMDAEDGVSETFSDIEELSALCRFRNCSHKREPGCAVQAAIQNGTLDRQRFEMYLSLMSESGKNSKMKAISIQRKQLKSRR